MKTGVKISTFEFRDLFHYPPISLVTLCPPRGKECLWLIYIHLLLANISRYSVNQLSTLLIDSYYRVPKSSLSQSETWLNKSRSALLECAIHVFNSVSLFPPFCFREDIVKEIRIEKCMKMTPPKISI